MKLYNVNLKKARNVSSLKEYKEHHIVSDIQPALNISLEYCRICMMSKKISFILKVAQNTCGGAISAVLMSLS